MRLARPIVGVALGMTLVAPTGAAPASIPTRTVTTIAGPGFCPGDATVDGLSTSVRALAVDQEGRLFFDTGPPDAGFVARVGGSGQATRLSTGIPAAPDPMDPVAALSAPGQPSAGRLAPDGGGGLLITAGAKIVDLAPGHGLLTLAGDPARPNGARGSGSEGDGGPAIAARFRSARSLVTDESGNVYIADEVPGSSPTVKIRFINRGTSPVTFYSGTPQQLTVAPSAIDTIAGGAAPPGRPDASDSLARSAVFRGVRPSLAVNSGRLYVASYWGESGAPGGFSGVQMVNLGGATVTAHGMSITAAAAVTVAGGGPAGFRGDGGGARAAAFGYLPGIAADRAGNLFLADTSHQRVRRIDAAGITLTIAGSGPSGPDGGGFNGNGRPAVTARLNRPADVKLGAGGLIYISDQLNRQIRVVDPGGNIRAAPGENVGLTWKCATALNAPSGFASELPSGGRPNAVAADEMGNIYVVLSLTNQVKRIDGSGLMTTVAGRGLTSTAFPTGDGGDALTASLNNPIAITTDPRGNLFVLDDNGARVRFINLGSAAATANGLTVRPGHIDTVAGNGRPGYGGDGGKAVRAQLSSWVGHEVLAPVGGLAVGPDGSLFIADFANSRVRRIDSSGVITTFAGTGAPPPRDSCCHAPTSVGLDSGGNVLISDAPLEGALGQSRVWFVNGGTRPVRVGGTAVPAGSVAPIAGDGSAATAGEGVRATSTGLGVAGGLATDRQGNVYIAEIEAGAAEVGSIRRVDPAGIITTMVGDGGSAGIATDNAYLTGGGFNGDGRRGELTSVRAPTSVIVDRCGNLVFTDAGNDRVRRLDLAGPCPVLAETGPEPHGDHVVFPAFGLVVVGAVALGVGGVTLIRVRSNRRRGGFSRRH